MKHLLVGFVILAAVGGHFRAKPEATSDLQGQESPAQRDARMAWWRDARFGMFIHWGLYSVPAGMWNGARVPGIGEWIMNSASIPVAQYEGFAQQFDPVQFDADAWARAAKDAGMRYIII